MASGNRERVYFLFLSAPFICSGATSELRPNEMHVVAPCFMCAVIQGLSVGWNLTIFTGKKQSIVALTSMVKDDIRSCM